MSIVKPGFQIIALIILLAFSPGLALSQNLPTSDLNSSPHPKNNLIPFLGLNTFYNRGIGLSAEFGGLLTNKQQDWYILNPLWQFSGAVGVSGNWIKNDKFLMGPKLSFAYYNGVEVASFMAKVTLRSLSFDQMDALYFLPEVGGYFKVYYFSLGYNFDLTNKEEVDSSGFRFSIGTNFWISSTIKK